MLRLARKAPGRLPGVEVLVTGRRHDARLASAARELQAAGEGPIRLLGYVPQTDLAVLLTHALALYFPSRYEGFGIPALEAMAAGALVVASRAAALPEIVGDAGILLANRDSEDEAIDRFSELQRAASSNEELRGKGRSLWAEGSGFHLGTLSGQVAGLSENELMPMAGTTVLRHLTQAGV